MDRVTEPELMNDTTQAAAYAHADFSPAHNMFIEKFKHTFPISIDINDRIIDLGCGAADISIRFARAYPYCSIDAIDGAEQMLIQARQAVDKAQLGGRIKLMQARLPSPELPSQTYDVIISNSLLHHLHQPQDMWQTIYRIGVAGGCIFIMDLLRPESKTKARSLVELYAADEPQILQDDFYNSLCAAFRPDEIAEQLYTTKLGHLKTEIISDRHIIIYGTLR